MTQRANLYVDQGTDFVITIDLSGDIGFDFTENDFFCDVKKIYSETKKFSAEMTVISDESNDFLNLVIDKSKTTGVEPGKYSYDVLMRDTNGNVSKILEGLIFILATNTVIED
jgi:hypothetical protein